MARSSIASSLVVLVVLSIPAAFGFFVGGEQYYVQHKGGRAECGLGAEFLGFLNKTCEAGTKNGPSYGPTCGPTLRGASDGQRWKQWTVTVVGQDEDGNDLATIENFYPEGKGAPLCLGNMVPEKKDACATAPWAGRVHIHPGQPYVWRLVRIGGDDTFQIVAHSRVAGCLRFLGGSATCTEKYVQFYADDDGSGQQRWVLTPVVARSPPPPPPSPPPPPVCTPGYGVEGGACAKCAAGTYSPGGAETECKPCAPGSHSPSPGWAFCLGCKGNTIAAGWGAAECTVCYAPDRRRVLLGSVPLGCTNGAHSECDPCCGNRRRRGLLGC